MKASLVLAVTACAHAAPPIANVAPAGGVVRAKELFAHPEWVGREVDVEIVEPLELEDAQLDVGVHDVDGRLALVSGTARVGAGTRPPLRVHGVLEKADDGLRLRVAQITKLAFPAPQHLHRAADLIADPARWSGQYVTVEDTLEVGFEASWLGGKIWLDQYPDATIRCEPRGPEHEEEEETARVRVTGFAYTAGRYGHLGMGKATIVATEVSYCR